MTGDEQLRRRAVQAHLEHEVAQRFLRFLRELAADRRAPEHVLHLRDGKGDALLQGDDTDLALDLEERKLSQWPTIGTNPQFDAIGGKVYVVVAELKAARVEVERRVALVVVRDRVDI